MAFKSKKVSSGEINVNLLPTDNIEDENSNIKSIDQEISENLTPKIDATNIGDILTFSVRKEVIDNKIVFSYRGKLVNFKYPKKEQYPEFFIADMILNRESKSVGMSNEYGHIVDVPLSIKVIGNLDEESLSNMVGMDVIFKGTWGHNSYGSSFDTSKIGFVSIPEINFEQMNFDYLRKIIKMANIKNLGVQKLDQIKKMYPDIQDTLLVLSGKRNLNKDVPVPLLSMVLTEVPSETIDSIIGEWNDFLKSSKDLVSLLSLGLNRKQAKNWVEQYKSNLTLGRKLLHENPWSLVEIEGIGFVKADEVAFKMGFKKNDPKRFKEALLYGAEEHCRNTGSTQIDESEWIRTTIKILQIDQMDQNSLDLIPLIKNELIDNKLVKYIPEKGLISPYYFYNYETKVALLIADKLKNGKPIVSMEEIPEAIKFIEEAQNKTGNSLDDSQYDAVMVALTSPVAVLTGGPGSGKTTTLQVLSYVAKKFGRSLNLSAPTGKAAKRMNDQIQQVLPDEKAQTIHRALKFDPKMNGFIYDTFNKLEENHFVIDESSMLDIQLAYQYISAIPNDGVLLFVGDINQLASVSPGGFLNDLIYSGQVPVARLTKNHRSKDVLSISDSAKKVLNGETPTHKGSITQDGYTGIPVKTEAGVNPNKLAYNTLKNVVIDLIEKHGTKPEKIQVLMPLKGTLNSDKDDGNQFGVYALNNALRPYFNPFAKAIEDGNQIQVLENETDRKDDFFIGDRIMFTQNEVSAIKVDEPLTSNEDRGLFNGDMGIINRIVLRDFGKSNPFKKMDDKFKPHNVNKVVDDINSDLNNNSSDTQGYFEVNLEDGRTVKITFENMKKLKPILAYVITIHKSQGSERDVIVMGLADSHRVMLNKNLVYTGITRAKYKSIVVHQGRSLSHAVKIEGNKRQTGLLDFINVAVNLSKAKLHNIVHDRHCELPKKEPKTNNNTKKETSNTPQVALNRYKR